jgi:hypothetical protein
MKKKVIKDPIHNIIEVEGKVLDLLNTRVMQRLRRVKQLGTACLVYPAAEHSRFTHSLGVYHIAKKISEQLSYKNKYNKIIIQMAALLHDVGHVAFSHTLEKVLKDLIEEEGSRRKKFHHETFGIRIIQEDEEIRKIISRAERDAICKILRNEYEDSIAVAIISSQLDADRLDFLLRDSYMTGAGYGNIDLEWLIRTLRVAQSEKRAGFTYPDKVIAVDYDKGFNTLDDYILGRFYMYNRVYLHKVVRGFDAIVKSIFKRFFDLDDKKLAGYRILKSLRNNRISLGNFLLLDDYLITSFFYDWLVTSKDKVLKQLVYRFLYRRPFKKYIPRKSLESYDRDKETAKGIVESRYGKNFAKYFFLIDEASDVAYENIFEIKKITEEIFIYKKETKKAVPLSSVENSIVNSAKESLKIDEVRWFVPEDLIDRMPK